MTDEQFQLKQISYVVPDNLIPILNDAFYARIFENENILLVQKLIEHVDYSTMVLEAYDWEEGIFKFKVEIPEGYALMYPCGIGANSSMGMLCVPEDYNNNCAIEYLIDKNNGNLTEYKKRLFINSIKADKPNIIQGDFTVTNFKEDKKNNKVCWIYNEADKIEVVLDEQLDNAFYYTLEKLIIVVTEKNQFMKNVFLYNVDGTLKYKVEMPEGFEIIYCGYNSADDRHSALGLVTGNNDIAEGFLLFYWLIPETGEFVYLHRER